MAAVQRFLRNWGEADRTHYGQTNRIAALVGARMRALSHHMDWVATLVGDACASGVSGCPKRSGGKRGQDFDLIHDGKGCITHAALAVDVSTPPVVVSQRVIPDG